MTSIEIIGVGRMGAGIAYSLMLMGSGLELRLYEPHAPNKQLARAEFYDLMPVAVATGNDLCLLEYGTGNADYYVLCAGKPRTSSDTPKSDLLAENLAIAAKVMRPVPPAAWVFVVANPPKEIAEWLTQTGYLALPLRDATDMLRSACGDGKSMNTFVLDNKGYTHYTPAFACARAIMRHVVGDPPL